ncbi:aldose 1-epimerase [Paenibacillus radicis (ex Xue et al. 2023)]|uniref:Aldose 1-epimerase n=1 Tax=Paenibacillus radicis (ex Xue et al. 2023) TaxID=2972489 RepID=A0ABT1YJD9_9BACL|nr:aldose 1-epimerase [Paenibacillus radicis (ex Xue et al. 2023)]MCR8632840.1 aldose 1-epimerase [Paenibacillus radicis (ex Xue et al. 2023)]
MAKQIDWQGTPAYILENDQLIVSICPAIGNNVYSIWDKKLQRELLRTPESPTAMTEQFVQYGTPILMPPNRIRKGNFQFDGRNYQFNITQQNTGNHIHGVIRQQSWTVTQAGVSEDGKLFITSSFNLNDDVNVQRQYPHALELEVTYTLDGSELIHSLKATNRGTETAPFGYGLHTWFLLDGKPESWKLQLPVSGIWELDEQNIPTGEIIPLGRYDALIEGNALSGHDMDTVFQVGDNPCIAILSRDDVEIRYSGSDLFKQWVIYTKGEAHDFICLEPYTWVTNAPNIDQPAEVTGVRGIQPGNTLELEVALRIVYKTS